MIRLIPKITESDFENGELSRQNLLALLKRAKELGIESLLARALERDIDGSVLEVLGKMALKDGGNDFDEMR